MSEEPGKEEEKFDFTAEGEGYISLDEARVFAMQTASSVPGNYGRSFRGVAMVFEVESLEETDDFYEVTLSFRPQGNFDGTPGQEQFVVGKEGTISVRQVLASPASKGGGFPVLPVGIGLVVVGAIAAIGVVIALSSSGGDSVPIAAVTASVETDIETKDTSETLAPTNASQPISKPTQISRPTPGAEVGNDKAQFLSQSNPKSCPECNLAGANLARADLTDADLSGANLSGANLTGADLTDADLFGADLTGANLTEATLTGADLSGANLHGVNLTNADLTGVNLHGSDLSGANLTDVTLTGANLFRADLFEANLSGVIGADFAGAKNIPFDDID